MSKKKPKQISLSTVRGEARLAFEGRRYESAIPLYESHKIESVTPPAAKGTIASPNLLLRGDCLSACALLKARNISADLVYIDPPFDSGADYKQKIRLRNGKDARAEGDAVVGEEVAYGDIWGKENYLNWMFTRLRAIREIMSPTAGIYVHLDWHIGHYVKVLMDEVFGEDNFRNEIVWFYHDTPGRGSDRFARKHDTLLYYAKGESFIFNGDDVRIEIQERSKKRYETPRVLGGREYIGGESAEKGKIPEDVWTIPVVKGNGEQRTDYATQKPEALLERIIKASSNPNMVVADFFCGSGTAAKVAHDLGRRFIACDIGGNAIRTTRNRLSRAGASFDVEVVADGMRLLGDSAKIKEKLLGALPGFEKAAALKLGDFWDGTIADQQGGRLVKFFDPAVLFAKKDVDMILTEMAELRKTSPHRRALIIYAHKEAALDTAYINRRLAQDIKSGMLDAKSDIKAMSVDEWLKQRAGSAFPADSAVVSRAKLPGGGWRVTIEHFYSPYLADKFSAEPVGDAGLELIESVQFETVRGGKDGVWRGNPDLEDTPAKGRVKGVYEIKTPQFRMKICSIAGEELIISEADCKKTSDGKSPPPPAAKPARKTGKQPPRRNKSKPARTRR
jgi:adenine-specific DNA-methyltransferase